jgi:hypothetical protein
LITRHRAVGQWFVFLALAVLIIGGMLYLASTAIVESCACTQVPEPAASPLALAGRSR